MLEHELSVEQVSIDTLKPAEYNPRKWSDKQIADLKESVKRFGLVDPFIVNGASNRRGVVIGGHFRLKIAKDLGYKKVPVVYVDIPDPKKEKELNLRLNANVGSFDLDILKSFDPNLLLDVGFDSKFLAPIWDDLMGVEPDDFDVEKEIKRIKATVKEGERYRIGDHVVFCGDSTKPETLKLLLNEEKADITLTDMPFNISLSYDKGMGGKKHYGGDVDDSKTDIEYRKFVTDTVRNARDFSKNDAHFFWYCDQNYVWLVQIVYKELGIKPLRLCLWLKNSLNPTPKVAFNKSFEPAVYGTIGKPYISPINNLTEVQNKEVTVGNDVGEQISDLIDIWYEKRLATNSYNHPTEKPPTLHEKAIRRCSRQGDVVLDLFGGSGSVAVCAHQLGRRSFTVERDPVFCTLIINRLTKLTGQEPREE
jgi:DNA modification methylase